MKKGFTLIELLIVVAIIAILAAIAIPNFLQAQVRAKVSRAQADMRSITTAIESYFIDYNMYPAYTTDVEFNAAEFEDPPAEFATFIIRDLTNANTQAASITTPIAYMTSIPKDPFGRQDAPFRYFSCFNGRLMDRDNLGGEVARGTGWILVSFGPNTNFPVGNIPLNQAAWNAQDFSADPPTLAFSYSATGWDNITLVNSTVIDSITNATYDPTNGTISAGDLWRTRQ